MSEPIPTAITGTLFYRERMALPPNAEIYIQLLDVSAAPPLILNEQTFRANGRNVPFSFALPYDVTLVSPDHTYALNAFISVDEQRWFYSLRPVFVLTNGHDTTADVLLVRSR